MTKRAVCGRLFKSLYCCKRRKFLGQKLNSFLVSYDKKLHSLTSRRENIEILRRLRDENSSFFFFLLLSKLDTRMRNMIFLEMRQNSYIYVH